MSHIFISYKSEDPDASADFIGLLTSKIQGLGFDTWDFGAGLIAGDEWRMEIDQAIKTAAALVVVITPAAKASEYVTYEWAVAWGAGVPVIPLLLAPTRLHPRLEAIQYQDFTGVKRPWDALAKALHKKVTALKQAEAGELAAFWATLRDALDGSDALLIGPSARDQMPPAAKKAAEVFARHPSRAWQDAAKVGTEVSGRLKAFQQAHNDFIKAADRLDPALRRVIRLYNASTDTIAINDPADLAFFLGRIHGVAAEDLLPWIDMPAGALPRFEKSYATASADPEVMALVPPYRDARKRLLVATEELKKSLP
jgi:TIR domain